MSGSAGGDSMHLDAGDHTGSLLGLVVVVVVVIALGLVVVPVLLLLLLLAFVVPVAVEAHISFLLVLRWYVSM
jgi:hypothetical protein